MIQQILDGVSFRMGAPFDFAFLQRWGRVFRVFDDQDSGNICFGTEKDGECFFVKFAGAPTLRATVDAAAACANLRATLPLYRALRHRSLIQLVETAEVGGGFAMVFRWRDAWCMGRMYGEEHARFMALPVADRLRVLADAADFLACTHAAGYTAIDFYDGSIMYDPLRQETVICDIDFFRPRPCVNDMGRMWGSSLFMSPEEYQLGAGLDEVTNVYTLGALAFALFGGYRRDRQSWQLGEASFRAAAQAVAEDRAERPQSIDAFMAMWQQAVAAAE